MQAVILAAGSGKRLRPITDKLPKALVEMEGKSLLGLSLDALRDNRIKEVIIVTGYLSKAIEEKLGKEYKGMNIDYVLNNEYDKTGSMYSLSKIKDRVNDDIILLESDLLYDSKAIGLLLSAAYKDCILVAPVSGSGDEVYICVDPEHRVISLGKNMQEKDKDNAIGALVGISRFSKGFLDRLFRKAAEDFRKGEVDYHYEECVFETSKRGMPVYAVLCEDLIWIEIDNESGLKRAREQIYPKLKG